MKNYSINLRSTFIVLQDFFMFTALNMVFLCVILYFLRYDETEFLNFLIFAFILYYLPTAFIPVFILLINYEQYNAGMTVGLGNDEIIINSESIKVDFIEEIIIYGAHQHFHRGYGLLPHAQDFFYMEIKLFDNRKYYVTCLMSPQIDKEFKNSLTGVKFVDRIKVFPKI